VAPVTMITMSSGDIDNGGNIFTVTLILTMEASARYR
jgi:hypothetical protein